MNRPSTYSQMKVSASVCTWPMRYSFSVTEQICSQISRDVNVSVSVTPWELSISDLLKDAYATK